MLRSGRAGKARRGRKKIAVHQLLTGQDVFFFQAEDGIRDDLVTGVQTCALPISPVLAFRCHYESSVGLVAHAALYVTSPRASFRELRCPQISPPDTTAEMPRADLAALDRPRKSPKRKGPPACPVAARQTFCAQRPQRIHPPPEPRWFRMRRARFSI